MKKGLGLLDLLIFITIVGILMIFFKNYKVSGMPFALIAFWFLRYGWIGLRDNRVYWAAQKNCWLDYEDGSKWKWLNITDLILGIGGILFGVIFFIHDNFLR